MRIRTETSVGLFIIVAIGIFLYMSFQIGVIRFDVARYQRYNIFFTDVSGLAKKAEVKIAGVKVGWVESVELAENNQHVHIVVMILGSYVLYQDAYGVMRQDGLLGTKYIELVPGDPRLPTIPPDGILMQPSKEPVSVDDLLFKVRNIAQNVETLSRSMKDAVATNDGVQNIKSTVENFNKAAERIASAADSMNQILNRNSTSLDSIVHDIQVVAGDLKQDLPNLTHDVRDGIQHLNSNIERTTEPLTKVVKQVSEGDSIICKLIHDDEMGRDVQNAVCSFKRYCEKIDKLAITFDNYFESMYGLGNYLNFEDAKGYINVRIHPQEDYFYLLGLVGSYSGRIIRTDNYRRWFNDKGQELIPTELNLSDRDELRFASLQRYEKRWYDQASWNVQIGKIFGPFAIRGGLFESTFGVGVDIEIPLCTDYVRWITTFEAYDFFGRNRLFDDRAHLKWMNRLFFADTLYTTFGADDFISKTNRNAFFGFGITFGDDDIKYLISRVGIYS